MGANAEHVDGDCLLPRIVASTVYNGVEAAAEVPQWLLDRVRLRHQILVPLLVAMAIERILHHMHGRVLRLLIQSELDPIAIGRPVCVGARFGTRIALHDLWDIRLYRKALVLLRDHHINVLDARMVVERVGVFLRGHVPVEAVRRQLLVRRLYAAHVYRHHRLRRNILLVSPAAAVFADWTADAFIYFESGGIV